MKTKIATVLAALSAVIVLSIATGGQPARAQSACPCFTSADIDAWYTALSPSARRAERVLACVDDPGFTTLDFLSRSTDPGQVYVDVTYPTSRTSARCLVDLVNPATRSLPEATGEISQAQADACRAEVLRSRTWAALSCPNN